jgi:hypothetical protein
VFCVLALWLCTSHKVARPVLQAARRQLLSQLRFELPPMTM